MHAKAILPREMYAKKGKKSRMHLLYFENSWISRDLWSLVSGKKEQLLLSGSSGDSLQSDLAEVSCEYEEGSLGPNQGCSSNKAQYVGPTLANVSVKEAW